MIDIDDNSSENYEQVLQENDGVFTEYLTNIQNQCATVTPDIEPTDFIKEFVISFLNLPDLSGLEDRSILVDDRLSQLDHNYLRLFTANLDRIFDTTFGITLHDSDIYIHYCLYQMLVTKFADYFLTYLNGLQKLDEDYAEDIENWNELSFEYFRKKIGDESPISVQIVKDYIHYICESGIIPEYFFEICLLESEGNVELSTLFLESSNNRIDFDDTFFILKLSKILTFDIIEDTIADKFLDIMNSRPVVEVSIN